MAKSALSPATENSDWKHWKNIATTHFGSLENLVPPFFQALKDILLLHFWILVFGGGTEKSVR